VQKIATKNQNQKPQPLFSAEESPIWKQREHRSAEKEHARFLTNKKKKLKKSTKIEKPNQRHRKNIQKEANACFCTRSSSRPLPIRVFRTKKQQQQIANGDCKNTKRTIAEQKRAFVLCTGKAQGMSDRVF